VRVILPPKIVEKLQLRPLGKTKVRYADMREAERDTVHGLVIEILGRRTDPVRNPDLENTTFRGT